MCVSYLNSIKQIEALVATAAEVDKKHQLRAFDKRRDVGTRPPCRGSGCVLL